MEHKANDVAMVLRVVYSAVPIVAGFDKFTDMLVAWQRYIPRFTQGLLPVSNETFMGIVGVVEIAAGLLVMSRWGRLGAWIVSAWLVLVSVNLVIGGFYDIAVRDLVMAVGAWCLGHLTQPAEAPSRAARVATQA